MIWKVCINNCGDREVYCFLEVDDKWTEITAQALLKFLLPPSPWQPNSMIRV
jgi:hypothetical protein